MSKNFKLTFPAMIAALAIVLLYMSGILPTMRLAFVALAGVIMSAVVIECGMGRAFVCFAAAAAISFAIVPDKGNVLMFAAFFGHYPIIKCLIERIRMLIPEWIIKIAVFNVSVIVMYILMKTLFAEFIPENFPMLIVLITVGTAAFIVYDIGLTKLITYYMRKIRKYLHR